MIKSKLSEHYKNGANCAFYKHERTNRKIMAIRYSMSIDALSGCILNIHDTSTKNHKCKTLSSMSKNNIVYPISKIEYNDKIYRKRIRPLSFRRNKNIVVK